MPLWIPGTKSPPEDATECSRPEGKATAPKGVDAMEMDVWYDVLVRELAEAERLSELLAQAEEETGPDERPAPPQPVDSRP
jgi:hypothetical protein